MVDGLGVEESEKEGEGGELEDSVVGYPQELPSEVIHFVHRLVFQGECAAPCEPENDWHVCNEPPAHSEHDVRDQHHRFLLFSDLRRG